MSILDTFFILFESDTSKLDKGLGESEKKAGSFLDKLRGVDKEASKTGASFAGMVGKLAGVAGVALSIGALVSGVKATAAQYAALERLALQFRDTVEAVDEFRDASGLLGISEEKSTESLHSLNTAIQDTVLGMGRAKKVFEELGIEVKNSDGTIKGTTQVMGELAEKFKTMDKGTQIRVMERLGLDPALLKLFNSDLGALQKRMADVDRAAGFNLTTAVKRASEYTKASKELNVELKTIQLYLSKLSEAFKIAALPWFTAAVQKATGYVREFLGFLMKHSHFVEGLMIAVGAAISYYLIPAAINGAIAVWAMIAPFALIALAAAAAAAVFALLYDDITNFLEGNDSLIGDLVNKYPAVADAARMIGAALKAVWDVATGLVSFLVECWTDPLAAWDDFQRSVMDGLNALFEAFPELKEAFDLIASGFQTAGQAVADVWGAIVAAVKLALGILTAGIDAVAGVVGKVKGALGIGGTPTAQAAAQGQGMLGAAASSPLTSTTSNAISNTTKTGGDRSVKVEKVEVHTQATDAQGISRSIGQSLGSQLRQASSQFDDGVAA
jgi:hypothetical protein